MADSHKQWNSGCNSIESKLQLMVPALIPGAVFAWVSLLPFTGWDFSSMLPTGGSHG
jgi:hypothetical protein